MRCLQNFDMASSLDMMWYKYKYLITNNLKFFYLKKRVTPNNIYNNGNK